MGGKVFEVCMYIHPDKAAVYEVAFQVTLVVKNLPASADDRSDLACMHTMCATLSFSHLVDGLAEIDTLGWD